MFGNLTSGSYLEWLCVRSPNGDEVVRYEKSMSGEGSDFYTAACIPYVQGTRGEKLVITFTDFEPM
jgi:hypothetical protein